MQKPRFVLTMILLVVFTLTGCREDKTAEPTAGTTTLILQAEPSPPVVGEATLIVIIRGADDALIGDATVSARGDMSHAGMMPVQGEVSGADDGLYRIPFEWTMAGEWAVTVTATLADGSVIEQSFDYTVSAGDDMSMGAETTEEP